MMNTVSGDLLASGRLRSFPHQKEISFDGIAKINTVPGVI